MATTPYWTRVIKAAKKRKKDGKTPFTRMQVNRAMKWQTCACAEQDSHIPRDRWGSPYDEKLRIESIAFCTFVAGQNVLGAERSLEQIEKHAARVLREVMS